MNVPAGYVIIKHFGSLDTVYANFKALLYMCQYVTHDQWSCSYYCCFLASQLIIMSLYDITFANVVNYI